MRQINQLLRDRRSLLIVLGLLGVGLFFRIYNFEKLLGYGHDEDLAAWIIKDVIVNNNWRLIGQETSIDGVFIGPLFYYLQAIYFWIFGMDPIGGFWLVTTISTVTLVSFLIVIRRFFGNLVAVIATLLYAASLGLAGYDRWVVPTQPTLLWCIWYLYVLLSLLDGNYKVWWILGILLGLIWHVHVAFLPLTLLIFPAIYWSKKRLTKPLLFNRYSLIGLVLCLGLISPFIIFEGRHGFSQTKSLFSAASTERGAVTGLARVAKVYDGVSLSVQQIFYNPQDPDPTTSTGPKLIALAALILAFGYGRRILGRAGWLFGGWFGLVIISQLISKRPISEYYFTNLTIIEIVIISVALAKLAAHRLGQTLVWGLLGVFLAVNLVMLINRPMDKDGYLARKEVVRALAIDAANHRYPCIGINYITYPGKNAGYRYFFWMNQLKTITPANDVAVYSLVDPAGISAPEIGFQKGAIGLIQPRDPVVDPAVCDQPSRQLLPLWGFND